MAHPKPTLPLLTLMMMITFAPVNAVLFTPALPAIANFYGVSASVAQQMVTWFLFAYAGGQLIYGPISNRLGRKPALYVGIAIQIASSLLCALAAHLHWYVLLNIGRFFLALGSGVGPKMAITLVSETHKPTEVTQKLSQLTMAFAFGPGLAVALGGLLTTHVGWISTFYAGAIYGFIFLLFVTRLPETQKTADTNALKLKSIRHAYLQQVNNRQLVLNGVLMGLGVSFPYVFATLAPFIAIQILQMSSSAYGMWNLLPAAGLAVGALISGRLTPSYDNKSLILIGIIVCTIGSLLMLLFALCTDSAILILFVPGMICYTGGGLIYPNATTIGMSHISDTASASAVISFICMLIAALLVLSLGVFQVSALLLAMVYLLLCCLMGVICTKIMT